jgi:glycosyltransferase involved in cell wall biosynthesis
VNPPTDVVITVRATREFPAESYFVKCIETLKLHTHAYRLIIVDDASDEIAAKVISDVTSQFREAILIKTYKQRWFTRAVNLGLRMVRTPYCVVLNCDTVLDTGWLEELYAVKAEVEATVGRVGLVGSVLSGEEPRRYALSVGQDYVTGHCLLFSMDALYEASAERGMPGIYLDEMNVGLIHIHSDSHICWQFNRLGWQCVKSFKSQVGHIGGKSWGQILGLIPHSLQAVNYNYEP